ncbi:MAG: DUF4363 family protein [Christensenellales bacterium]
MKRLIGIIFSLIFIIAVSVIEIVLSEKYINEIINLSTSIAQTVTRETFFDQQHIDEVAKLEEVWTHHENILCFMTNHNNIDEVGEYITKMRTSQRDKDYEEFLSSLDLVIFYANGYKHIFGVNIQNVV